MADNPFLEKKDGNDNLAVSYKIRKFAFPIAIALCVLLVVVCIVLAVLYAQAVAKPRITPEEKPTYEICVEKQCFSLGMEMVKNMDEEVDPCKDFYAYACQGWQKRNPVKNDSYKSVSGSMNKNSIAIITKALETARYNYSKNLAVLKTVRFYESCLNTTAADAVGLQPIKDLIQEYGGWSVSSNYDPNIGTITRVGKAIRNLRVSTLFGVYVKIDEFDSSQRILELSGANIELWPDYYLKKDNKSEKIRHAYKNLLKTIGRMFGSNSSDENMMAIYDFEKSIAKITRKNQSVDIDELNYHRKKGTRVRRSSNTEETTTLLSLCNSTGLPWSVLKEGLDIIFNRNFTGREKVSFYPSEGPYIKSLYTLMGKTNKTVIADYIMWRIIRKYIWTLPSVYNSTILEFQKAASNSTSDMPRSEICFYNMYGGAFDMALGLLYIDQVYKNDPKKKVETMFENIRSSFIDGLKEDSWMDAKTKENAKKKALTIIADIAYPSLIKNPQKLEKLYKTLHMTNDFFTNVRRLNHFEVLENLNLYDKPVDREKWTFTAFYLANGIYFASRNKITILAGIMQPPLYGPDYPMYLQYGGIGMIIGHEITHGFDGNGRKYDSNGNKKEWWSKDSEDRFKVKEECLVKQYDKYKVFDKHINGSFTLNENIADNGGIKLAYEAYQLWTKKNGKEKILPGLKLSPDQLFFLGYAQGWCSSYGEESAYEYLKYDPHSYPEYRIIGSLSNFDKFSEAFNCPANSLMNPSTKCGVW